ncbi:MAG: Enoyl-CoA hydratase (EC [uncultured Paraburkholderia sp.]|uniref:enoyl-CoA hydratase/isomerase family protein n=1 Tax=uncultured Paraburkholderia sp. TaxID=1822466 RepID=UPI0025927024|nr:enoyl-CoA hydratase-related protein [uncultured Paraburkholderia sp.]CAH2903880.1 MAG: Enoyl-CoA hydratase (EC [uncultured Paraburkholderia sp.]CAH2941839.1 MAG: Enoyl-CoA hydratase (EC [uncultured Paraburkholderia sp.]
MAIETTLDGHIAYITLNRPQALNALNFGLLEDLSKAFDEINRCNARALVVTGAGDKSFCAGADIHELMDRDLVAQRDDALFGQSVFAKLDRLRVPSIAVIHGYAFGGGLELAMACTFRIATPKAKLGLPEIKLGLIPGYGGTQRLPRLVGQARALDIVMSGRSVGAEEAERIGLVNAIVEGDDPKAMGAHYAERYIGFSKCASSFARDAVRRALDVDLQEGLRVEADLSTLAYRTADAAEGMRAFVEKRPAQFKDA